MDVNGFVKLNRSMKITEILKVPHLFTLLGVIALRAKRKNDFSIHNLKVGEALLGDHVNYAMSEQQYRTVKANAQKLGLATFRATTKGTVAKLVGTDVWDINAEEGNGQSNGQNNEDLTDAQRTGNGRLTTNKKERSKEGKNKEESIGADEEKIEILNKLLEQNLNE